MAKGTQEARKIKVSIGFDRVLFEEINGEAKRRNVSFAEVVRDLILLGQNTRALAKLGINPADPSLDTTEFGVAGD